MATPPAYIRWQMGRRIDVSELVGAQEIADRLDVGRPQVHKWRERHADFPQPVAALGGAGGRAGFLVWAWPDVERWARATRRYPPKSDDS